MYTTLSFNYKNEVNALINIPGLVNSARIDNIVCPLKGGGGGGFRPIILETLIMRYGLKGKARTRPDFFRVVLGPCAQFYPREAKKGPNTKMLTKRDTALIWTPFDSSRRNKQFKIKKVKIG